MKASILRQQVEAARKHLDFLRTQSRMAPTLQRRDRWLRTLGELSATLKRLRTSAEEICQLNRELRQASQALAAEHRRYLELFEFAPDGYLVTDAKGIIQEANHAAAGLLQEHGEHLAGKQLELFVEEAQRRAFREQMRRLRRGLDERMPGRAFRLRPLSGMILDVSLSVAAPRTPQGRLTHLRWLMRDITERKRAEAAVKSAYAALQRNREELRALAVRLLTAQEEERRRLSRELHDDMSQKLALLVVEIETLAQSLPLSPFELLDQLRSFRDRAVKLSDDVRNLAHRLHPTILEDLGLAAATRSYVKDFAAREGIHARLTQKRLPQTLPREVSACLYRVIQESLRNAAKHARTLRVSVTLTGTEGGISLSVRDWGVGFDPEVSKAQHGGLGVIGMKERVRLVDGTFSIRSNPGRGTRVMVRVPLVEGMS